MFLSELFEDELFKDSTKKWLLLSLVLHVFAAIFSVGFHHFDEHFQILELVNLKLGGVTTGSLTWEYDEGMRPWLQPWCFYIISRFFEVIGVTSRFFHVFIFRLLSVLLGWLSLVTLTMLAFRWSNYFKQKDLLKKWIPAFLSLLWFIPYIHARPSADNWGATFFILAFSLVLLSYPKEIKFNFNNIRSIFNGDRVILNPWIVIISGIIFGLSFQFRYQMGIAIFFFYLWCLLYGKMAIRSGLLMTLFLILSFGVGIAVDSWGYGKLTFSAWNYFYLDVIEGIPGKTIANPWWDYFRLSFLRGMPPISLLLMIGTVLFWIKNKTHPLTFITLSFFVVHNVFLHKELRYIFLVVLLTPIMTMFILNFEFLRRKSVRVIFYVVLAFNMILLFSSTLKPANVSASFIKEVSKRGISTLYYKGENPYTALGLKMNYYGNHSPQIIEVKDFIGSDFIGWFATTRGNHLARVKNEYPNCKMKYLTYPRWILKVNISNWVERSRVWALFKCGTL